MSEHETDTPQEHEPGTPAGNGEAAANGDTATPDEGATDTPQVPIVAPPEPDGLPPEPVGRTPEAEQGLPPSDESQGVGIAPTQAGDVDADGNGGNTLPRPSSEDEQAAPDAR